MMIHRHIHQAGFTLIEIVAVLAVMTTMIVGYTYNTAHRGKERAYLVRAQSEVVHISNAIKLQVQENSIYPADVNRALPPGIEKYIATPNKAWPNAPWPDSVYDYENWDGGDTIQVSVRFCSAGDDATCKANAKKYLKGLVADSVLNVWDSNSSVYYCIKEGSCRSHSTKPANHPGYRIDISAAR
jgi:prepilin-type N-terminal cleavage/methylation domain-containing protein